MTLHITERGNENQPSIVFLHGAGLGGWMWRLQLEGLADTFHCIAPDLPQHGQSEGIYSFDSTTDAIANLIREKAHDGKAFVVGLSLGGLIALNLMDKYPELIHRVIVSAPPSGPVPGTGFLLFAIRFMMPLFRSDFVIRQTAKQLNLPDEDYANFRNAQKTMPRNLLETVVHEVHAHRLSASLAQTNIPLLAVVGENEVKVNYRVVNDLVQLMPNIEARISPAVGHGWNGENPELFNQMIRDWFLNQRVADGLLPFAPK